MKKNFGSQKVKNSNNINFKFGNKKLSEELLSKVKEHKKYLTNRRFKSKIARFSNNLNGYDFSDLDLSHAIFENCSLKNTNFKNSDLSHSKFINCDINMTNFEGVIGKEIYFDIPLEKSIISPNFSNAILEDAYFQDCNFKAAVFTGANLISAYFTDSVLESVNFEDSVLNNVNFENTKFDEFVYLNSNTNLDYANFTGSNINVSLLQKTNLKNTLGLNNQFEDKFDQIKKLNLHFKSKNQKLEEVNVKLNKDVLKLEEENKILKEKKTKELVSGFEELEVKLHLEESLWFGRMRNLMFLSLIYVLVLFFVSFFNLFSIEAYIEKTLFGLILFSSTYFSVKQYTKSKDLRLENSNKIAIANGYQGFLFIHKNDQIEGVINKLTEVLFTKIKRSNDRNLPIDDFLKIHESFSKRLESEELNKLIDERIKKEEIK